MSVAPSAASRSGRTGLFALAHRRSTLVGVSSPWRVVRSMQVIARKSQAACHSFLTVRRVGMVAARRSTALRLIRRARMRSRSRGVPGLRSGWVNTRSARSGATAAGIVPAAGVAYSYRRFVSIAASNLRRLSFLRRVPVGLAVLPRPLFGCRPALRLPRRDLFSPWSLRRGCVLLFGRGCRHARWRGALGPRRRRSRRSLCGLRLLLRPRALGGLLPLSACRPDGTLDWGGCRGCRVMWWRRPAGGPRRRAAFAGGARRGGAGGGG